MSPALWRDALALADADEGARRFLAAHPELVDEIPVQGDPDDLDTPQDLKRWRDHRPD
jgi:molybdenum cofactor cytidylyltransferase/nicotine blue oxidoreductase